MNTARAYCNEQDQGIGLIQTAPDHLIYSASVRALLRARRPRRFNRKADLVGQNGHAAEPTNAFVMK
jgi:hypothetical protein